MDPLIKIVVFGALVLGVQNAQIESTLSLPALDAWWGPEETLSNNSTSIQSFEINFDEEMIRDLRNRLKNHRPFTPPLEGAAFQYGFNTDQMNVWLKYWAESYNFTERQAFLNQFPHYKTNIQGLDIHFIRVKPKVSSNVEVVPLLMLHGWPGSTREFYEAIPLITAVSEERDFAIEVIVPSLPGFGFSSAAVRPGLGVAEMGVVLRNLMQRLGYKKFYLQGGDWGADICNSIATQFPDEVSGYHTNFALSLSPATFATWFSGSISSTLQSFVVDSSLADRLYPLLTILKGAVEEMGYLHTLSTKPDTVGVAMSDSPSGLLAYILQLMSWATKADNKYKDDGGLNDVFTRDQILDNLMIYWMNNAFTTSARLYAESFNMRNIKMGLFAKPTSVPTWTIHAKNEIIYQSPVMLKYKFTNILNSTILDIGGHFLALEEPEVFSENVITAVNEFLGWHRKYTLPDGEL